MTSNLLQFQRRPRTVPPERAVYTVVEVGILLGVSRSTAYELVRNGTVPSERLGRRIVIPRVRFHAWLDNLGADKPATPGAS